MLSEVSIPLGVDLEDIDSQIINTISQYSPIQFSLNEDQTRIIIYAGKEDE